MLVSISIRPSSTKRVRLAQRARPAGEASGRGQRARPAGEGVADRGRQWALAGDAAELGFEPGLKPIEDRPARLEPRPAPLLGGPAADRFLHPVERGDPLQRLGGDRRSGRLVDLEELAPGMGAAVRQLEIVVFAFGGQPIEAGEGVDLERAPEAGEMVDRVLVAAVFGVATRRPRGDR